MHQQDCRAAHAAPADGDHGLFDSASLLKDAVTKEPTLGDIEAEMESKEREQDRQSFEIPASAMTAVQSRRCVPLLLLLLLQLLNTLFRIGPDQEEREISEGLSCLFRRPSDKD